MFAALFLLAAAQGVDPLAEARAGKQQCVSPNVEKRKCLAIASYVVRADGSFDTVVQVMIAPSPLVVMETRATGRTEGELICSIVRKADYEASTFTTDGKPADAATASAINAQILPTITAMDGKKACSKDRADGSLMIEEVTLDGVARPDMTQRFLWVRPEDGYTLGQ